MDKGTHASVGASANGLAAERDAVLDALRASGSLSVQSLARVVDVADRFCGFCARGHGIDRLADVSAEVSRAFVRAPTAAGEAAPSTMHLRRSTLRLLFRAARSLGLADADPTLDLVLPPRSQVTTRALTDDEVALCRAASLHTLTSTRLPAAWALTEASARSAELGRVRVVDVDKAGRRVWLAGSPRIEGRWAPVSPWGWTQIERRVRVMNGEADRPLVYDGSRGSDYHRQAASCVAVTNTLKRAGFASEPDVRPLSVVAWAGRQVLGETGRIDEVARRLGIRSLDRAASLIGWEWAASPPAEEGGD